MKLAAVVHSHCLPFITKDTVDAVLKWATDDVIVVVDEAGWQQFNHLDMGVPTIKGPYHNCPTSPYRPHLFGLMELYKHYPDADWYLHLEYDTLILNPGFKVDLEANMKNGVWVMGIDHRIYPMEFPVLEDYVGERIKESHYFIGCCQFYRNKFMREMAERDLFATILAETARWTKGYFPGYTRHGFDEELCPSLAVHFGGRAKELGRWDDRGFWSGSSLYRVRYRPLIENEDISPSTSIAHPVKGDTEVRDYYRGLRLRA